MSVTKKQDLGWVSVSARCLAALLDGITHADLAGPGSTPSLTSATTAGRTGS